MSKIICDVCGSAYADTADQCPICGTAKRDTNASKPDSQGEGGYHYVKGGRFSHANVRKHNSGKELTRVSAEKQEEPKSNMPPLPVTPKPEKPKVEKPKPMWEEKPKPVKEEKPKPVKEEKPKPIREEKPKPVKQEKPKPVKEEKSAVQKDSEKSGRITNIILAVIVLILLALVVYAGIYIVRNYETLFPSATTPTEPQGTEQTVGGVRIPCVGITLPALDKVESSGDPVDLGITFNPSTTTDEVTYVSSDPTVATVNFKGQITVHSSGSVIITITCGDQTAELSLDCVFVIPTDPTDPTDPSQPTPPPVVEGKLMFVDAKGKETKDVTFTKYGEEYQLYKGEIDASLVTFTSSNPEVVTVDAKGKIKVVGKGEAVITAQYGDQKIECNIRCNKVEVPVQTKYELSETDITMAVGYRYHLQLLDKETRAPVTGIEWYLSMPGTSYVLLEQTATGIRVTGNEVTVGVPGVLYVRVMCDYEGVTYQCIFRIVAPQEPETAE